MPSDLVAACAVLDGEGLTTALGHLSERGDRVLMTPIAGPWSVRSAADLVEPGRDDGVPGEAEIHLGVLRARPDVMSVCRFHGPAVLAYGTLGRPLPATTGMGLFLGAEVPCFETSSTVRTPAEGDALAATLGDGNGVLLRGFGAATVGRSVPEAVVRAWLLERSADAVLRAGALATPLTYDAATAAPFAAGEGPAATQVARLWRWLCARHPTQEERA